jgi:hypothetical protein
MSLQQWLDNAWIIRVEGSRQDTASLLAIAEREIADATLEGISVDGRFSHAYNAVRMLCQVALHAEGYAVPKGGRQHERTLDSLRFTLDGDWTKEVDYFDRCRRSRHKAVYEQTDVAQRQDADQLLTLAERLLPSVKEWLRRHHADLMQQTDPGAAPGESSAIRLGEDGNSAPET